MRNLAGTTTFLLLSFSLPLTGQAAQPAAHDACPGEPGSRFCAFFQRYVAQEQARKRIVAAARKAGMEDPSGVITVRRDSATDALTIEKWELELPESVEARLNGYLTALVMEHCRKPGSTVSVNLDLEPPVPLPHPDSADRRPEVLNRDRVNHLMARLREDSSTAPLLPASRTEAVFSLFVDAAGNVREIRVEQSSGSEFLDAKIVRILEETRPRPTLQYGAPAAGWIDQPVILYPQ